jgi:halocyanin-like protein
MGRRALLGGVAGATAAAANAGARPVAAQGDAYGGWFDDVDNYEGTVDLRGRDEVTVAVGTGEDNVNFDPPAILVDPGTTVVWEWTDEGGGHNVVHEPGEEGGEPAFASEIVSEAGHTFEQTFEDEAATVYRYYCEPHRGLGMKGAVAVGDVDDELIDPDAGGGGQPLTATDLLVVVVGVLVVVVLLLAVLRPETFEPDEA